MRRNGEGELEPRQQQGIDGMIRVNPRGNWRNDINMDAPDGAAPSHSAPRELHWDPASRSFK